MLTHRLRHRVTIQQPVITQDFQTGENVKAWGNVWLDSSTEMVDVPAEILTGPGRELNAASTKRSEDTVRITLRWFPGFSVGWRVLWGGHIYDITSVEYDATARRELRLRGTGGMTDGG